MIFTAQLVIAVRTIQILGAILLYIPIYPADNSRRPNGYYDDGEDGPYSSVCLCMYAKFTIVV